MAKSRSETQQPPSRRPSMAVSVPAPEAAGRTD